MKDLKIKQKAFTLFELLVVISIIGILVALGTVAYSNAQKKARDSRAKSDIKSISDAFEQYYVANDNYNSSCSTMASDTWQGEWPPTDSRGRSQGESGYAYSYSCSATTYCVCAELEQGSGGNASDANCTWENTSSQADHYCMTAQQ
jgi:prepilin-type N-terminal cleavage/methylation domain-containing protein